MHRRGAVAIAVVGLALLALQACGGGGTSSSSGGSSDNSKLRFVNVVKLQGVGWFNRMDEGIKKFAKDSGVNATQTGADDASPEKQVKIIQDLVAQKPTVIGAVPNSPESLEGVLKRAQDSGIVVVTHEASNQHNTNVDIEAFDNKAYGAHIMDNLAQCMGNSGKYVAFVGHLTARSHMEWVQGALDQAKSKYSGIQRIGDPIEGLEDENVAYQKTKELLTKNPDLKGFEGSASTDVAGIGRAIQELGLQNKTCVMGTSIPSVSGKYLQDGSVKKIFFWDPSLAGEAMMKLGLLEYQHKKISPGLNLNLTGYESLKQSKDNPKLFYGSAWVDVEKGNMSQYPF